MASISTGGIMDLIPALVFTIPLTIIFTWLYNKSKYSILAVFLLHGIHNSFQGIVGSSDFPIFHINGFSLQFSLS